MVKRVLVLMLGAVALVLSMTTTASAAVATSRIQNVATQYCMDGQGGIHMAPCRNHNYQRWTRTTRTVGGVTYTVFKNYSTGLCIDGNDRGAMYSNTCNRDGWQDFLVIGRSPYAIKGNLSGKCLDHAGPDLKGNICNNGNYQRWKFIA